MWAHGVAGARVKASPYAKKLASTQGVDLDSLQGSGTDGRIVAADVMQAAGICCACRLILTHASDVLT